MPEPAPPVDEELRQAVRNVVRRAFVPRATVKRSVFQRYLEPLALLCIVFAPAILALTGKYIAKQRRKRHIQLQQEEWTMQLEVQDQLHVRMDRLDLVVARMRELLRESHPQQVDRIVEETNAMGFEDFRRIPGTNSYSLAQARQTASPATSKLAAGSTSGFGKMGTLHTHAAQREVEEAEKLAVRRMDD